MSSLLVQPVEGDTRIGVRGGLYVFHNGRWNQSVSVGVAFGGTRESEAGKRLVGNGTNESKAGKRLVGNGTAESAAGKRLVGNGTRESEAGKRLVGNGTNESKAGLIKQEANVVTCQRKTGPPAIQMRVQFKVNGERGVKRSKPSTAPGALEEAQRQATLDIAKRDAFQRQRRLDAAADKAAKKAEAKAAAAPPKTAPRKRKAVEVSDVEADVEDDTASDSDSEEYDSDSDGEEDD